MGSSRSVGRPRTSCARHASSCSATQRPYRHQGPSRSSAFVSQATSRSKRVTRTSTGSTCCSARCSTTSVLPRVREAHAPPAVAEASPACLRPCATRPTSRPAQLASELLLRQQPVRPRRKPHDDRGCLTVVAHISQARRTVVARKEIPKARRVPAAAARLSGCDHRQAQRPLAASMRRSYVISACRSPVILAAVAKWIASNG